MDEKISNGAVEARRAYYKAWRAKNKDKVKEANRKYWEKKSQLQRAKGKEIQNAE